MSWKIVYLPEAVKDMKSLAGNQQLLVAKALNKVSNKLTPGTDPFRCRGALSLA